MIKSMTGYGKGENAAAGRKYLVEIKAVNNKYCEISVRQPRFFNPLEEKLRKLISARIFRGRIDININFTADSSRDSKIVYNQPLAEAYNGVLLQISRKFGLISDDGKMLELVARFPDVVEIEREFGDDAMDEIWQELSKATEIAIDNFLDMRRREGEALARDIRGKGAQMEVLLAAISEKAPLVLEHYRDRLKKRMEDALGAVAVDEARFLNEIAHFSDKASIDEEITRLNSHISQLYQILDEGGNVGRKLDFLAQEMAREANTIGSKATSVNISKIVIDLKGEVEKIREQVQNIE